MSTGSASFMQRLFGKPLTPDELCRKWRQSIRAQERLLDRQVRGIQTEEQKVIRSLKDAAKRKDEKVCRSLAKELVHARKARDRIITSKAQLNSVGMQLQQQMSQLKVMGSLQKSTSIMKAMNGLVKLPEISMTMEEMSREMMKAGVIEEMIEDTMEGVLDTDGDIEEEAEGEVQKVLDELTAGVLGQATVVSTALPEAEGEEAVEAEADDEMRSRLEMLKS